MTKVSKYDGLVFEGRWQFKKRKGRHGCIFENIYNHNTIEILDKQVDEILDGTNTISKIITRRIPLENNLMSPYQGENNVQKYFKESRHKYAKKQ